MRVSGDSWRGVERRGADAVLGCADSETRRQAASDFTRALMEQFEHQVTAIVTQYVGAYLSVSLCASAKGVTELILVQQQYAADLKTNWKSKDTAIFLLTSIASLGSTVQVRLGDERGKGEADAASCTQQGVTSTNALVDVIKFFSENILGDLQAPAGAVHPIIQADAIKFLYTFRNQVRLSCFFRSDGALTRTLEHSSPRTSSSLFFLSSYRILRTLLSSFIPTLPLRSSASCSSSKRARSCASFFPPRSRAGWC